MHKFGRFGGPAHRHVSIEVSDIFVACKYIYANGIYTLFGIFSRDYNPRFLIQVPSKF